MVAIAVSTVAPAPTASQNQVDVVAIVQSDTIHSISLSFLKSHMLRTLPAKASVVESPHQRPLTYGLVRSLHNAAKARRVRAPADPEQLQPRPGGL